MGQNRGKKKEKEKKKRKDGVSTTDFQLTTSLPPTDICHPPTWPCRHPRVLQHGLRGAPIDLDHGFPPLHDAQSGNDGRRGLGFNSFESSAWGGEEEPTKTL